MSNESTESTEQSMPVFTSNMVNWLFAMIAGIITPWLMQTPLAVVISSFNTLPELSEISIGMTTQVASIIVAIFLLGYITVLAYQIWFIGVLKTHSSVFALVVTLFSPISIWFLVPLIMNM